MTWNKVTYELNDGEDERVTKVIEILKSAYSNGDVILKSFRPVDIQLFEIAWRTASAGIEGLLKHFLESESIRALVPELKIPPSLPKVPNYTWYSGYEFEGAIIHMIIRGGAYITPKYSEEEIRKLARDFVDALTGDARGYVSVYRIDGAWTEWFYDVAWDSTFILLNFRDKWWKILCATDTD